MHELVQIYLPLLALLFIMVNGLFLKKTFLNWLPMVLILAGLDKFYGSLIIHDSGDVPSIVANGSMLILSIGVFIALSYKQYLRSKGERFQYISLAVFYAIAIGIVLAVSDNYTSGLTVFNGSKLILGVVLSVLLVTVLKVKFPFLANLIGLNANESRPILFKGALLIIIGLSIYLGVFISGWYGVAVFASALIPTMMIISNQETEGLLQLGGLSVLSLLGIGYALFFGPTLLKDLGQSHLLFGAFFGGFVLILGALASMIADKKKTIVVMLTGLLLILIYAFGYLYQEKENLGGLITYVGILTGISLMIFGFERKSYSFEMHNGILTLAAILLFSPIFEVIDPDANKGSNADKLAKDQKQVEITNDKGEKVVLKLNDITEAKGNWEIFLDNSKLKFTVVSHGNKTKGTFKEFSGKISITEDLNTCSVEMNFNAESLNTYNKTRDKEVKNGSDWMEVGKYPGLTFQATGFKLEEDHYVTTGELTMKGISKKIPVKFVFDGMGENEGKQFIIVSGSLSIDMTEFGIQESSEVDKGVEIEFTVEANKLE